MKKILIFISLFLFIVYTTTAQSVTANQFNGRLQMTAVSNVSDSTWSITGYFTNSVNKYTTTQVAVNDKFFCQIGANTYVGRISVINSASDVTKLITFRVICNYPNPPNNIGAIVRATSNGYPVFVDGLPNALQAGIQNYFATLVNTNAAGSPCEQTITKTAHGFRKFTPVRWNGTTFVRPTHDTLVPDYIVVDSLTANTFKVANCGTYTTTLTNGLYWFTSTSPGYSLIPDTTKVPLFQALNGKLILNPIVGFNLMSGSGDVTSSVLADTAAAIRADFKNGIISELPLDDVVINTSGNSLKLKNALDSIVTNANSEKLLEITGTYDSDPTWQSTLSYYDYGYLYARTAGSAFDAIGRIAIERSRGTLASPTTVNTQDRVGEFNFRARGSSSFRNVASIMGSVDSVSGNTVQGSLRFGVAKDGEPYLSANQPLWIERLKIKAWRPIIISTDSRTRTGEWSFRVNDHFNVRQNGRVYMGADSSFIHDYTNDTTGIKGKLSILNGSNYYSFATTSPSTTLGEKRIMTWTGTGSAATPAFEVLNSGVTDGDKGDITVSGGTWAIDNNVVTSSKVASQTLDSTDLKNRGTTLLKLAQSGATNGQVPVYNSTSGNWEPGTVSGGSGSPGGATTQVQYNNAGSFAGDSKMTFNSTTKTLTVSKVEVTDMTDSGTPASAVRINRSLTSEISQNAHGFRDQSVFSRPGFAYAGYDGAMNFNGSSNYNHGVSFQSRISASTSGTISDLWGSIDNNSIDGARVTRLTSYESAPAFTSGVGPDFRYGFRVRDVADSAPGSIGTQYGVYVDSLGNGSTQYGVYIAATKTGGYAVYSPGRVTSNYYAGKTSIGSVFSTSAMGASLTVDNVLNNSIPALVVSVDASANQRKSIIFRQDTRANLSFSDFSGNFQPSLQLQSDDNSKMLWIAPSGGTGGNAMMYAGATGFEIVTGSSVTSGGTSRFQITNAGRASFGVGTPTAAVHIKAGTATANTAPLKFNSGTNLTTAEAGAVEYDGTEFYATNSTASRTILARVLKGSATLDFPDTASGSSSSLTITVTGAATTDSGVSVQRDNASISGTSYEWVITGANTVTVYFHNFSGSNQNPASGTFRASVTK